MAPQRICTIMDLLQVINTLYDLIGTDVAVDADGWPVFRREHFATEWPQTMVPYTRRNNPRVGDRAKACLCFYAPDDEIYPRFVHVAEEVEIYRQYAAVVFPDITVTRDMDPAMQETILLANHLFAAVLASQGIRLVFNTRCGLLETQRCFRNVPPHVMCASGFLGCANSPDVISASPYINKILRLRPDKLMIFGKHDKVVDD